MTSMKNLFAAIAAVGVLAGCSSVKLDNDVPVETRTPTATGSSSASGAGGAVAGAGAGGTAGAAGATGGAGQSKVTPVEVTRETTSAASNLPRVVYFDFDSYAVKDEYRPAIEAHAKVLSTDRKKHLAIEGHTDERGGREYNLALGQQRAESVAKALTLLGATDTQVEAVSFGKERPAVQGNDEAAWAKNRRADLVNR